MAHMTEGPNAVPSAFSCQASHCCRVQTKPLLDIDGSFIADIIGAGWEFFSFAKHINIRLQPCGSNNYECIVLVSSDLLSELIEGWTSL